MSNSRGAAFVELALYTVFFIAIALSVFELYREFELQQRMASIVGQAGEVAERECAGLVSATCMANVVAEINNSLPGAELLVTAWEVDLYDSNVRQLSQYQAGGSSNSKFCITSGSCDHAIEDLNYYQEIDDAGLTLACCPNDCEHQEFCGGTLPAAETLISVELFYTSSSDFAWLPFLLGDKYEAAIY